MRITPFLLAITGAAVLLGACARDSGEVTAPAAREQRVRLADARLGSALGPTGAIARGAEKNLFQVGELVHLAVELADAPTGTVVHAAWKGPGNEGLGEETKRVRPGQRFVNFAADADGLPAGGGYRVEVSVNGRKLTQLQFELVLAAAG